MLGVAASSHSPDQDPPALAAGAQPGALGRRGPRVSAQAEGTWLLLLSQLQVLSLPHNLIS